MRISIIPFSQPFLPTLAKYIVKSHQKDIPNLNHLLVIFPSERNKLYFREYLLDTSKREGIIPSQLYTLQELYEYLMERMSLVKAKVPNDIERNTFLKEAIDEVKAKTLKDLPFIEFISIGRRLLEFFDELKIYNFTIERIEKMQEELHFPSKYTEEELPILKRIHSTYQKILKNYGLAERGEIELLVAEKFKDEYLKEFKHIYIAGFLAFTPSEISLIKKILNSTPSHLIFHSDKNKLKDISLENVFYHHAKVLHLLGANVEEVEILDDFTPLESPAIYGEDDINKVSIPHRKNRVEIPSFLTGFTPQTITKTPLHIQKSSNPLDEVSYIIYILSSLLKRYQPSRIAIILPDESLVLPLTTSLEKFKIIFNLSMGIPLKNTPLYSFLKSIYEVIDSKFHTVEFLGLLKHPLFKGVEKDGISFLQLVYELDRRMKKRNLSYFNKSLKDSSNRGLLDFILGIIGKLKKNCPFSDYVRQVREIIHELLNLNEKFLKSNSEASRRLIEELLKLENISIPDRLFPLGKDKLKFLIKVLEGASEQKFGDFLNGIQIIGILEARNLDFSCIIIPSCNEGVFPKKSEKDLFLPANLRKEVGLPYHREREALYSYYFHQMITGKKEVYLSYRTEENGELTLRSRWIEEFLYSKKDGFTVKEDSLKNLPSIFSTGRIPQKRKKPLEKIIKDTFLIKKLEGITFSPHSLKTYKECGYKFYLSYILKLKKPPLIQEEFDFSIWGTIIHKALKRLYGEFYPEGYREGEKSKVKKTLERIGEEEFRSAYPQPKASLFFEWENYKKRLENFIDKEILRFKEGFKLVKVEEEFPPYTMSFGNNQKVKLTGVADRIDKRDGKFYIIDYKTTRKPEGKTYRIGENFVEFQLPLYAIIFTKGETQSIDGLIYYHLDEDRSSFLTLDILKKEGKDYLSCFKEQILIPTLSELFNQKLPFTLTDDFTTCKRCLFVDHCRRRI